MAILVPGFMRADGNELLYRTLRFHHGVNLSLAQIPDSDWRISRFSSTLPVHARQNSLAQVRIPPRERGSFESFFALALDARQMNRLNVTLPSGSS